MQSPVQWKALKIATIAMGVLIVLATGALVAVIAKRQLAPAASPPIAARLDEPAGTRIAAIAATQDRLALSLQGGGPDRVVLIDPRTGARTGAITLAR